MKILLADDHTLFRDTMLEYVTRSITHAEIHLAKNFESAFDAAFKATETQKFDLIMLDLRMPGMNGLQGLRKIICAHPFTPVVLMSGMAEREEVEEAYRLGAAGYFPKTLSGPQFIDAIRHVASGKTYAPTDTGGHSPMPSHYADPLVEKSPGSLKDFSPREIDVLSHLVKGELNKQIATTLGVQEVTIKMHVRSICKKMGVRNRTQAALKASEISTVAW